MKSFNYILLLVALIAGATIFQKTVIVFKEDISFLIIYSMTGLPNISSFAIFITSKLGKPKSSTTFPMIR